MRPTQPLAARPAGYLQLESYSSLRRFWSFLDGAQGAGRRLTLVRGDSESTCRRRIEGFALRGAGGLLDVDKALLEVEDGVFPGVEMLALAAGDPRPLQELLSERYELRAGLTLAFTARRDLVLRAELTYHALERDELGVKFVARRFSKDELRFVLDRACGAA